MYLIKIVFFSILIFFGFSIVVFSQDVYIDVVYLKDGTIIKGKIIELIPNKSIKIQVEDTVFVYNIEKIDKTIKESVYDSVSAQNNIRVKSTYQGVLELELGYKNSYNSKNNFKINFINDIRFNPYFSLGLGVGILRNYNDPSTYMPIFGD